MKNFIVILATIISIVANAQTKKPCISAIGFELDALPYITGGYYGSVWVGHNHFRYRGILTKLTTPEFVLEEGFTNNKITAYTFIADYFFKPDFEKWWVGAGVEYWEGSIQTKIKAETANYTSTIATAGGGYVWKFYKNFYLNPWAAVHLRIAGDNDVKVDEKVFKPSRITPEVSLKLGWYIDLNK
jgi:hypothetical protein